MDSPLTKRPRSAIIEWNTVLYFYCGKELCFMEPRKHYFAKIPTIAIFIVMAMSGPLGVLLFILKGIDQKA